MYISRAIEKSVLNATKNFPCIVLYGPRQVGKSTTIDYLFGDKIKKVTLDDIDDRKLAKENPRIFLETYGVPLIIDEIQKAPELLDEIKKKIDEHRSFCLKNDKPRELMYVLTGSNRFELQQGISDSLAGRCGVVEMLSLSQAEINRVEPKEFNPDISYLLDREKRANARYKPRKEIFKNIFYGGMPDIITGISERNIYFKSYVNTYIEKDVKKLIAVSNEILFRNFISILALRTAQEVHYDEIANNVGIDVRTCKNWLSILETSGIIYFLQPYFANISKRIIKAPKLYFTDTGLCSYLCKWQDEEMLENCAMGGAFFETYVVSEIIKNLYAFNKDPKDYIYYYRDIDQKEVDLLYIKNNEIYPIEIKKGINPSKPTKNFKVLSKYKMPINKGLVIDCCDKIRPINEEAYSLPVHLLGI